MTKITLADGTEVEFEGINGNNFIVGQKEMDVSVFTDENLLSGKVETDDGTYEFENLRFTQQQKQKDGNYYICFHEETPEEKEAELEKLLVQIATVEVEAGNIDVDDIPLMFIKEVKQKVDADKKLEL